MKIYSKYDINGDSKSVTISGHVKKPGKYELYEQNMTLGDILFKAGGFNDLDFKALTFTERADILRLDDDKIERIIISFNLAAALTEDSYESKIKLFPGDEIIVYSKVIFNSERSIQIDGVVRNPGKYALKKGMTVKDLIIEAGGVSESIFRYKIEISRIDPNVLDENTFSQNIILEMDDNYTVKTIINDKAALTNEIEGFQLKPYDYISIRPDPHFRMHRKVKVSGAVYYPGTYALIGPEEKLTDIINRSGGLRPKAYPEASILIRNNKVIKISIAKILKKPNSKENIVLQNGDEISIEMYPDMIEIIGGVSAPGIYKYQHRKRVNDYIELAGGFALNAEESNIWVTGPDGKSQRYTRWLSNPLVKDGSIINVGMEKDEEPFDKTEFAKELASIISDLAQVAVMIIVANR